MSTAAAPLEVSYLVRCPAGDIEQRAEALLLEQTVELPRTALRDRRAAERVLGRVTALEPAGEAEFRVTIAHPSAAAANDPAQLLNVLFGNASLLPDVVLAGVTLPDPAFAWLPGPRAGIAGLRGLTGVSGRPLVATALKPMGLGPDRLASLCRTFAEAGLDLIKDDHGLADHPFCPFEARVEACVRATEGTPALYLPNLIGTPDAVLRQLAFARAAGVRAVLLAPMLLGLPFLHQLATMTDGLPIVAHPAFGGVLRAAEPVLFGTLFRWYGADAVIFPHTGGRFSYSAETCRALAGALRAGHPRVMPAFPAPAGGITLERMPEIIEFYGRDCILLVGGSLYQAGDAIAERARALVEGVAQSATAEPAA